MRLKAVVFVGVVLVLSAWLVRWKVAEKMCARLMARFESLCEMMT